MLGSATALRERTGPVRFGLRFIAIALVLFAIYGFPYAEHGLSEAWLQEYLNAYAKLVGRVLTVFEPDISVVGNAVHGRASIKIVRSCDAMDAKILFTAAVLACPGAWSRKALALGLGLVAIATLNVIRITTLYYISAAHHDWFEFLHVEIWPLLLVVATAFLFLACVNFIGARHADLQSESAHAGR